MPSSVPLQPEEYRIATELVRPKKAHQMKGGVTQPVLFMTGCREIGARSPEDTMLLGGR